MCCAQADNPNPSAAFADDESIIDRMVGQLSQATQGLPADFKLQPVQFEKVGLVLRLLGVCCVVDELKQAIGCLIFPCITGGLCCCHHAILQDVDTNHLMELLAACLHAAAAAAAST